MSGCSTTSFTSRDVELFLQASELERLGDIGSALKFYERAFRLNPHVDRSASLLTHLTQSSSLPGLPRDGSTSPPPIPRIKFIPVLPGLVEETCQRAHLPDEPQYEPLGLPAEIVMRILGWVGYSHAVSLEECARTCRRMYLYSRCASVWRFMYFTSRARHLPPVRLGRLETRLYDSYREQFLLAPRVRTDGIYICKISYFRPGLTEGSFFQPVHLVTYYRYLRFFGEEHQYKVNFLLSTDEPKRAIDLLRHPPSNTLLERIPFGRRAVQLLLEGRNDGCDGEGQRDTRTKGANFFVGRYRRESSDPHINNFLLVLFNPQATHGSLFEMHISVSSSHPAGNNVIRCHDYISISPATLPGGPPNIYQFNTQEWGKFLFSRVRSYHT